MSTSKLNKHSNKCSCPICNNGIREERQYAALQVKDGAYLTFDVEEIVHIDEYQKSDKYPSQPNYPFIVPDDDIQPILAYGVIIPQYDSDITNWGEELQKHKEYAFGTLENNKVFVSAYSDFMLFENDKIYNSHIPFALLLYTSLDLSKKKDYGFGYTSFLLYKGWDVLTNILNRKFLFCLGDMERSFDGKDLENWKKHVNKVELVEVAKRLF